MRDANLRKRGKSIGRLALLIWSCAAGVGGCDSTPPKAQSERAGDLPADFDNAPVVGALYEGSIPDVGLVRWDLRSLHDTGDSGTPHAVGNQTVAIKGRISADENGARMPRPFGTESDWEWRDRIVDRANSVLPGQFDLDLGGELAGSPSQNGHFRLRRTVIFRQWQGRYRRSTADFPVFEDDSEFHRQVSFLLARNAWEFVVSADDGSADSPGFADQTMDICLSTENLISIGISEVAAGGSNSMNEINHNFVNEAGRAREFTVGELFRAGSGWDRQLSDYCLADLRRQYGPYDPKTDPKLNSAQEPPDPLAPFGVLDGSIHSLTPEQFSNFNVVPAGLCFSFSSSDVGGGKGCWCGVTVPWSKLRNYLRPDGPAQFLTALFAPNAKK